MSFRVDIGLAHQTRRVATVGFAGTAQQDDLRSRGPDHQLRAGRPRASARPPGRRPRANGSLTPHVCPTLCCGTPWEDER
ncbi:hypothetical protein Ae406Ps2_0535c [Pseudonocardia sp. Ae406_Ps2]|nr:hypothetical protein Ae406Ps2_0535c [Pseudonocardia sp. Ae406_Ps2]OLM07674.1 hypothetical protein Ae331Ps2_5384 [Pseudonocardia sp. Ae331_Ps2]